ncbi:hypothetical protein TPA0910_31670 [Streptomyces hygroscopicus subsp. sporocinereus]|uniref:Secreted protein n=1 Tax=Streptomyces hygroscopicus TaxID=1912 RepID=A0ABQ3TZG6_STRHY|nr:hypothetical protein TPA0910_31670 [Streptomyces hygroscopicus]
MSVPGPTVKLSLFTLAGLLAYPDTAGAGPDSAGPAPGGTPDRSRPRQPATRSSGAQPVQRSGAGRCADPVPAIRPLPGRIAGTHMRTGLAHPKRETPPLSPTGTRRVLVFDWDRRCHGTDRSTPRSTV